MYYIFSITSENDVADKNFAILYLFSNHNIRWKMVGYKFEGNEDKCFVNHLKDSLRANISVKKIIPILSLK